MKLWKIAIVLVAIIAVSAGAYMGVSKSVDKKEAEQIEASGAGTFFEFDDTAIKNISFTYTDSVLEFSSEDSASWTCDNDTIKANSSNICYAISTLATLNTTKIVESDASDLSIYGLDNPITISCSDGTETYTVQVGNTSPTGESYYIKSPDNNDVYTISQDDGLLIHLEPNDLKSRYIIETYVYSLKKIVYTEGDTVIFDCEKDEQNAWQLLEPSLTNLSIDLSKMSSIADLLIRADVIDFIDEDPSDLSQYGLDNPKYTLEIADEENDRTVYFGDSPEDNVIYAQFADTKEVVTFYMGEVGILGSGTEAVLSDTIYSDSLNNITNLKLEYGGETYDFQVDYDSDDRSYTYSQDGKVITDEDKSSLLSILVTSSLNIPLYDFDMDAEPSGDPVLTVTYTRNYEPNEYVLEFIPTDEESKYYYVLMDGKYLGCIVRDRALNTENQLLYNLDKYLA